LHAVDLLLALAAIGVLTLSAWVWRSTASWRAYWDNEEEAERADDTVEP
jgi:hypothetical protein